MLAVALALTGLLASCSSGGASTAGPAGSTGDSPSAPGDPIPALAGATLAQLHYGSVPTRNNDVTYAPDVVLVDGGADAIRSLSADGLTWTIKGDAPHANELAVGKVMLITGRAVGRVLSVQPAGPDITVIVGPVDLTDVIEKADVQYDKPLDLGSMIYYNAPAQPGSQDPDPAMPSTEPTTTAPSEPDVTDSPSTDPSPTELTPTDPSASDPSSTDVTPTDPEPDASSTTETPPVSDAPTDPEAGQVQPASTSERDTVHLPAVHLIAERRVAQTTSGDSMPLPTFASVPPASAQQGVTVSGIGGSEGLGYTFNYNRNGIKLIGRAVLHLQSPKIHVSITIDHGIKAASVLLDGAAGLSFSFDAGNDVTPGGVMNDNPQAIDMPFDISIPLGGPTPFAINIRQAFKFQTLFGARLATLSAKGEFTLGGSIGVSYHDGSLGLTGPTGFSGTKELASSVTGDSLGVNGLILTDQIRVIVGMGGYGFAVGPSFTTIFTMAVTKQSDLGAIPCTGAQFKMQMGVGLGYSIPPRVADVINFFLKIFKLQPILASAGLEHVETLASVAEPTSGPCKT